MNRLTADIKLNNEIKGACNGSADTCDKHRCNTCPHMLAMINKLAEYERTGFEPHQIKATLCDEKNCVYKNYFNEFNDLSNCNDCAVKDVCKYCPKAGENTRINCPMFIRPKYKVILKAIKQCVQKHGAPSEMHIDNGYDFVASNSESSRKKDSNI